MFNGVYKGLLILLLATAVITGSFVSAKAVGDVELKYFSVGKKVIPLTARFGNSYFISDIVPPDVIVINKGLGPVTIRKAAVIGLANGNEVVAYRLGEETVKAAIVKANIAINNAVDREEQAFLHFRYGNFIIPESPLAEDTVLGPGKSAVFPLPDLLHIHYVGMVGLDALRLEVSFDGRTVTMPIDLTFYTCKGKYIFPLRDDVHIANLPANLLGHRHAGSQEFAFDVIGMKGSRSFSANYAKADGSRLEDHYIFNRNILAMADGKVIATGTKFPEALTRQKDYFINFVETARRLAPQIGILNTVGGNYIVIDHGNGEYAFYAHIREGHVLVKPGDQVKQGQVIGRVGNTGNSSDPHLHFHLMDSPDVLTANGLPVMFTNIPISMTYMSGAFQEANSLLYTDDIYLHVD